MTRLEDCFRDYLAFIRHEKGYAQRTLESYTSWSKTFLRWLGENGYPNADLSAFATPVLRRYLYNLSSRMRPRSVRSAFFPLKGLAKFLVETGALQADPVQGIAMPKKDAPVRRMVSDGDIGALLSACEKFHLPRKIALYCLVIATLTYTGVRAQELLNLKTEHVDPERKMLTVHAGKGSKTGHLYPCDEWWQAYREWMLQREFDTKHPYLFSVDRGRRLGIEGLY
ncbi:MAG: tyrosine-type recombinase/integrase, partial [Armatimonadota bacterium]